MAGRALALFAVLLTAAFAGCSGKGGGPTESDGPSSTIVAGLEPVEDAGSISGLVIDDSQLPIVGASAAILELSLEATTDEGGRFLIGNLAPATYTVAVGKLGYSQAVKKVVVGPSEAVEKTFILEAVAVEEAGSQIFGPYTGFLVCGFVRPGVQGVVGTTTYDCGDVSAGGERPLGQHKNAFDFKARAANIHSVVGETKWNPSAAATSSQLQTFFSYSTGSGTHWWCSSRGASPTSFVYSADEEVKKCYDKGSSSAEPEPTKKLTLRMQAYLPFCRASTTNPTDVPVCVTYQQHYTMMSTIFYGEAPPAGYSALPDT